MGAVHAVEHGSGEHSNHAASELPNERPGRTPADERDGERSLNAPRGPARAPTRARLNARWRRYAGFGFASAIDDTADSAARFRGGPNGR